MRILASLFHPIGSWPYSGSERRFCAITLEWRKMGVETLALEPTPFAQTTMPAGYVPLPVSVSGRGLLLQLLSWAVRGLERGLSAARQTDFDVVYATNNNLFNLAVSYLLARRLSLPCVAVVHHLRWVNYQDGSNATDLGKPDLRAFLQTLIRESVPVRRAISIVSGAHLEATFLKGFDGFTTVSEAVARQMSSLVPNNRTFTSGNGVWFGSSISRSDPQNETALFVGRLDEGKGAIELLHLWERVVMTCPSARLEVVGEGSFRTRASLEVGRRGLSKSVEFHGFVTEADLAQLRARSRLFVTVSRTEGFGLAIAEALASGLPGVAWDLPPIRESFEECSGVHLSPLGDLEDMAHAITLLFGLSDEKWRELSNSCSKYVHRFSWRKAAERELQALLTLKEVSGWDR